MCETSSTKRFGEIRPVADAVRPEHVEPVLDPGAAVRDDLEVPAVDALLLRPVERAVVGRDDAEDACGERVPQMLLVLLRAGRRRVDLLRALEVRLLEHRLVDEQVLRTRLAPGAASPSRARPRPGRSPPCTRRARRRAPRRRRAPAGWRGSSPRPRSPAASLQRATWARSSPRPAPLLTKHVDGVAVLGVHHHERPGVVCLHCITLKSVVSSTMTAPLYAMKSL